MGKKTVKKNVSYKFTTQYSGNKSKEFWAKIHRVPANVYSEAYTLGCLLQDFEGDVIARLDGLMNGEQ